MDFLNNPFYILNATPHDNTQRIMELANERSLFQDPDECRNARAILTNPLKRVSAEIAWLPVKDLEKAEKICELQKSSEGNLGALDRLRQVQNLLDADELMPIAKCNVLGRRVIPSTSSLLR